MKVAKAAGTHSCSSQTATQQHWLDQARQQSSQRHQQTAAWSPMAESFGASNRDMLILLSLVYRLTCRGQTQLRWNALQRLPHTSMGIDPDTRTTLHHNAQHPSASPLRPLQRSPPLPHPPGCTHMHACTKQSRSQVSGTTRWLLEAC